VEARPRGVGEEGLPKKNKWNGSKLPATRTQKHPCQTLETNALAWDLSKSLPASCWGVWFVCGVGGCVSGRRTKSGGGRGLRATTNGRLGSPKEGIQAIWAFSSRACCKGRVLPLVNGLYAMSIRRSRPGLPYLQGHRQAKKQGSSSEQSFRPREYSGSQGGREWRNSRENGPDHNFGMS